MTYFAGIMCKEDYNSILVHHGKPSLQRLFPRGDSIFQQDNDPKHTANINKSYFANGEMTLLDWPSQSPDLNPIENL